MRQYAFEGYFRELLSVGRRFVVPQRFRQRCDGSASADRNGRLHFELLSDIQRGMRAFDVKTGHGVGVKAH